MKAWDDLVSTALLGTAKREVPDADTLAARELRTGGVAHPEPAGQLLDQAAVLAVYRRAGVRPRTGVAVGEPAPAESRPRVSSAAARRLSALLSDRPGLLAEWLTLCAEAGARVPEEQLPELFERARTNRELAERFAQVAGARGRWLAAQNPDWQRVLDRVGVAPAETLDAEVWETGSRADRVAYLASLRREEPDAARELLAAGWAREDALDRAEFLALLAEGLADADEPFLEQALDDRRREVREAAALLLGRLDGSAYAERMRARLRACVEVRPGGVLGRKPQLEVNPPSEVDAQMRRDGIPAATRSQSPLQAAESQLRAIVARSPLQEWCELTGLLPEAIVHLTIDPHDSMVLIGWWEAARRQLDARWAAAIVGRWRPGQAWQLGELLELLVPEERRAITARMLNKHPAEEAAVVWIAECPGPWDVPLGRAVLRALGQLRRGRPFAVLSVREALAERLPAQLVGELEALAEQRLDPATATLTQVAEDIRFRHEMAQEFE